MSFYASSPEMATPYEGRMNDYFNDLYGDGESDGEDELEAVYNALDQLKAMLSADYSAVGSERVAQLKQVCAMEYFQDEIDGTAQQAENMLLELEALMDPAYADAANSLIGSIIVLLRD